MKSGLNQYFEEVLLSPTTKRAQAVNTNKTKVARKNRKKITLSQYFEKEIFEETSAAERMQAESDSLDSSNDELNGDDVDEIDIYTSYASYMSSSDPGSDNLLVTFDYGFQDSIDADLSFHSHQLDLSEDKDLKNNLFNITEEESSENLLLVEQCEIQAKSPNMFKVHQMQHIESDCNNSTRASSCISMKPSLVDCNIDTSGDYGSWAQCESEPEEGNNGEKTYRNYCYEDLIKNEVLIHDDDDGSNVNNGEDEREVLFKFNFDEDVPPRWFNNNEQLYYRSVDYLN